MERENFKTLLGFLLATISGAIGIANLIALPPLLHTHGILFAAFYLLFTIVIGIPVMTAEIAIGRRCHARLRKLSFESRSHRAIEQHHCLSFVVLTMTISVMEPVVSYWIDQHKRKRHIAALFTGVAVAVSCLPLILFSAQARN
jgi:SNF family Na+-dependent transporter